MKKYQFQKKETVAKMYAPKRIIWIFLLFFLFLNASFVEAQSGWTRNKGGVFLKAGYFNASSDQLLDANGNRVLGANKFSQDALTLYGEYGITKRLTAILNYPFYKFQRYLGYETASGFGDPQIELKWSLLRKIPVVSVSLGAELPFAAATNYSFIKTGDRTQFANLPAGDGDFNYWGTLAVSSGFGTTPGWATIWGQYNRRGKPAGFTEKFRDQTKLGFEVGYKWTPEFWTNARLSGLWTQAPQANSSFINGDGAQYTTLMFGVSYEFIAHYSLTFDYQTYTDWLVKRKNIYSTPLYAVGFSAEF
jgi:hypothetical protein